MTAQFYTECSVRSVMEAVGYIAEPCEMADGAYIIAAMASGQGPFNLGGAGVNSFLQGLSDILRDTSVFTEAAEVWKSKVSGLFTIVNREAYQTSSALNVQCTVSACAAMITPSGNMSIISSGNIPSFIKTGGTVTAGNLLETSAVLKTRSKQSEITEPDTTLLMSAMGAQAAITPKATKTKLTGNEVFYLLSAGFAANIYAVYDVLQRAADPKLVPTELMNTIKKQRGLACADAVLAVCLKGGGGAE